MVGANAIKNDLTTLLMTVSTGNLQNFMPSLTNPQRIHSIAVTEKKRQISF